MKRIFNYFMLVGAVMYISACAAPEEPSMAGLAAGEWYIENVFVNGEIEANGSYNAESLILDQNESFLFVEKNGRAYAGTWAIADNTLSLNTTNSGTLSFTIIALNTNYLHMVRTVESSLAGSIELRYILRR